MHKEIDIAGTAASCTSSDLNANPKVKTESSINTNNLFIKTEADEFQNSVKNHSDDNGDKKLEDDTSETNGVMYSPDDSLVNRLIDELRDATKSLDSEVNSDVETEETELLNQPVGPGHTLTLKSSILVIWMHTIAHCLTSSQLGDLLTLINLHLMVSHPVFNSVHRFKKA
ncbi:hypothetical protein DPMN_006322 [Dreissena polymorpha]|uniref:Uncharacterized protein n=1 Tax=Dreissena polymorpha TaxID=45954 RepID=A0A9D4MUC7_DREPO|nr:hypothetical protein DPMN_006322 [Dreissena polymorpha]